MKKIKNKLKLVLSTFCIFYLTKGQKGIRNIKAPRKIHQKITKNKKPP